MAHSILTLPSVSLSENTSCSFGVIYLLILQTFSHPLQAWKGPGTQGWVRVWGLAGFPWVFPLLYLPTVWWPWCPSLGPHRSGSCPSSLSWTPSPEVQDALNLCPQGSTALAPHPVLFREWPPTSSHYPPGPCISFLQLLEITENNRNFLSHRSGGQSRCWQGCIPSGGSRGEP